MEGLCSGTSGAVGAIFMSPVLLCSLRCTGIKLGPHEDMDLKKIVDQPRQQTSTRSGLVLPQVRYHPSIQPTPNRTSVGHTHKISPQAKTTLVQKKQADSTDQETKPGRVQRPGPSGDGPFSSDSLGCGDMLLDLQVPLDSSVVKQVEVQTRGQRTNPDWFAWRKNRITASVAHRIAHSRFANSKSKTPPSSYLAAITGKGPTVQTRAMSWGVQMEAEAVRRYQKLKTAVLGRPVSVQECGLFIDAQRSWLAASPDGIVTDGDDGQWLFCLEVKCPYKHRNRRVEDACRDDPAFCLRIQDQAERRPGQPPVYQLKTSHSYFTQVQVQLAVTGLQQADLVVFTLEETAVVPVNFDPELWEETVSKLERFYRKAVLPLIVTAATCRPEL